MGSKDSEHPDHHYKGDQFLLHGSPAYAAPLQGQVPTKDEYLPTKVLHCYPADQGPRPYLRCLHIQFPVLLHDIVRARFQDGLCQDTR